MAVNRNIRVQRFNDTGRAGSLTNPGAPLRLIGQKTVEPLGLKLQSAAKGAGQK